MAKPSVLAWAAMADGAAVMPTITNCLETNRSLSPARLYSPSVIALRLTTKGAPRKTVVR